MNKGILYAGLGIGAAGLAYLGYKLMQQPTQNYSPTSLSPQSNPTFTTDSYQKYPFVANVAPRVDNSNQPWANNNRAGIAGASMPQLDVNISNAKMLADSIGAASSIIDSGKSIWESVASWYDSGDADVFDQDWSMNSGSLSGSDWSWA